MAAFHPSFPPKTASSLTKAEAQQLHLSFGIKITHTLDAQNVVSARLSDKVWLTFRAVFILGSCIFLQKTSENTRKQHSSPQHLGAPLCPAPEIVHCGIQCSHFGAGLILESWALRSLPKAAELPTAKIPKIHSGNSLGAFKPHEMRLLHGRIYSGGIDRLGTGEPKTHTELEPRIVGHPKNTNVNFHIRSQNTQHCEKFLSPLLFARCSAKVKQLRWVRWYLQTTVHPASPNRLHLCLSYPSSSFKAKPYINKPWSKIQQNPNLIKLVPLYLYQTQLAHWSIHGHKILRGHVLAEYSSLSSVSKSSTWETPKTQCSKLKLL